MVLERDIDAKRLISSLEKKVGQYLSKLCVFFS